LKASVRVSRAQELAADALAAKIAGPAAAASALRKIEVIASAWGTYFHSEVIPLLDKGRIAPLLEGFDRYWRAAQTPDTPAWGALSAALEANKFVGVGDTHPPLADRVAALGDPAPLSDYAPPALGLLDDVPYMEERVLRDLLKDAGTKLNPVGWDAIADAVWLPIWRSVVEANKKGFSRLEPGDVPAALADWEPLARATRNGPAVASPEAERRRVVRLMATWFAVALADRGWTIEAPPGLAVRAVRDGRAVEPFRAVDEYAKHPDPAAWAAMCDEHGL
jgi:hypothetical protein